MTHEIERRFLLKDPAWRPEGVEPVLLDQGYFALGGKTASGLIFLDDQGEGHFSLHDQDGTLLLQIPLPMDELIELWHHAEQIDSAHARLPQGWKGRIRSHNGKDFIFDIKGPRSGTTRVEVGGSALAPELGKSLLEKTGSTRLQKQRYTVFCEEREWYIDVLLPPYDGEVTVEVELDHALDPLTLPEWVGEEITNRKTFLEKKPQGPSYI